MTDTLRGTLLVTFSMALFAIEDALIKLLSDQYSPAQIVWMLGLGGAAAFAAWLRLRGHPVLTRELLRPSVVLRTACEAIGACLFVSALAVVPLSLASAVLQATPLVVALGAVLFLGASVGWRRWLAIAVGFLGVLLILRPGTDGFNASTLLAVGGMLGLSARDVVTRTIPQHVSGSHLSLAAFAALVPAGFALQMVQGQAIRVPSGPELALLGLCVAIGMLAYVAIVAGTRIGDLAVVTSFRYSRMLFALVIAVTVFDERPDAWTLAGVGIVISSGVFMLWREARLRVPKR